MKTLLAMSAAGGALVLATLALRAVFQKKLSARFVYALWLPAALCLLLPWRVPSALSAWNLLPNFNAPAVQAEAAGEAQPAPGETAGDAALPNEGALPGSDALPGESTLPNESILPNEGAPGGVFGEALAPAGGLYSGAAGSAPSAGGEETPAPHAPWAIALWVWAAGAALVAGGIAFTNARFALRLRRSRRPVTLPNDLAALAKGTPVYLSALPASPCLMGVFRPAVYLTPAALSSGGPLKHVLVHELCHKRQGDHLFALLRAALLALHWFNPLVWLAASVSRADAENACDERAVRWLGEEERLPYGLTLLRFAAGRSSPAALASAATTMAQNKRQIKRRIAMLSRKTKTQALSALLCLLLLLTACTAAMTGPQGSPSSTPDPAAAGSTIGPAVPSAARAFMEEYEAAACYVAPAFEDVAEEELANYLSTDILADFEVYGRKNSAGDLYAVAYLPSQTARAPYTGYQLVLTHDSVSGRPLALEEYGLLSVTDPAERRLMRSYDFSAATVVVPINIAPINIESRLYFLLLTDSNNTLSLLANEEYRWNFLSSVLVPEENAEEDAAASQSVSPIEVHLLENLNLDGVGDADDTASVCIYQFGEYGGEATVLQITLGTGETLANVFPVSGTVTALLYGPLFAEDKNALVLEITDRTSNYGAAALFAVDVCPAGVDPTPASVVRLDTTTGITLREGELPSAFQTTLTCGAEFAELPDSPLRGIVLHAWENGSSVERTLFWEGGNFFADDGWALQPE